MSLTINGQEANPIWMLLPLIGFGVQLVLFLWIGRLLKKEIHISNGTRRDLSAADRTKVIVAMALSLLTPLGVMAFLGKIGFLTEAGLKEILLVWLGTWLREFGFVVLLNGIGALILHRRNEKKLAQSVTSEQLEIRPRQNAALSKQLRVMMPVMALAAAAIAAVWLIWFRDQRQMLLIAYAVYLVVGWIWLTWIILRSKKKESPKQEQHDNDENDETGIAPDDGRGI